MSKYKTWANDEKQQSSANNSQTPSSPSSSASQPSASSEQSSTVAPTMSNNNGTTTESKFITSVKRRSQKTTPEETESVSTNLLDKFTEEEKSTGTTVNNAETSSPTVDTVLFSPRRFSLSEKAEPLAVGTTVQKLPSPMEEEEEEEEEDHYSFNYEQLLLWEYDVDEFDPFKFMAFVPPKSELPKIHVERPIALPKKAPNMPNITLILDLDETLVHCSSEHIKKSDFVFPVKFRGVVYQVYVKKRPFFEEFLKKVSKMFEVVVFTASEKAYADKLLTILDKEGKLIHGRAFRESCIYVEGNYLKDLTVLGRDLSKVVIIDNSPQAYSYQTDNGIPILSWFDDDKDEELIKLIPFLTKLSKCNDVRPLIREKFKLHKVIEKYRHQG